MEGSMTLNRQQSERAVALCDNRDQYKPEEMALPDGDKNAQRVIVTDNTKTGAVRYSICYPWILSDIFSI